MREGKAHKSQAAQERWAGTERFPEQELEAIRQTAPAHPKANRR